MFAVIAIAAIVAYLIGNHDAVEDLFSNAEPWPILLSIGVMTLVHLVAASGFHYTHVGLGTQRPFLQTLGSYLLRLPARYIPGGVWHALARYMDIHAQQALPKKAFAAMFVVEASLIGVAGLAIAGISSAIWSDSGDRLHSVGMFAFAAAATLLAGLILCLRLFRIRLRIRSSIAAGLLFGSTWVVIGVGFAIYAKAFTGSDFGACPFELLGSAYELAASLGYVAIFAPQGWGVTELAFANLGACNSSPAAGVAAIAGFRLVSLVSDVLAYAATLLVVGANSTARHARLAGDDESHSDR